jgi:hypothetical protein
MARQKEEQVNPGSKRYHIFSTMTANVDYNGYSPAGDGSLSVVDRKVTIKGGAGIANKHLVTPLGVHTEISHEEMEFLNSNGIFCKHRDNGFISIQSRDVPPEKVSADMNREGNSPDSNPGSSPLSPSDFEGGDGKSSPKIIEK